MTSLALVLGYDQSGISLALLYYTGYGLVLLYYTGYGLVLHGYPVMPGPARIPGYAWSRPDTVRTGCPALIVHSAMPDTAVL